MDCRIKEDVSARTEAPPGGSSAGRPSTSGGDEPQPGSKKKKPPKVTWRYGFMICFCCEMMVGLRQEELPPIDDDAMSVMSDATMDTLNTNQVTGKRT